MSERCILFADVAGSTALYERLGDAEARHAVERCLKRVRMAIEHFSGRVLKNIGDGVLADFATAEEAQMAACEMQQRVTDLPPVGGQRLAIRVGMHFGPVIEDGGDIFGDAVNLAARMVELARPSQIIMTASTVALLPPLSRSGTRQMQAMPVKGKAEPVEIAEVIWRADGELTVVASRQTRGPTRSELILRCGEDICQVDASSVPIVLGREKSCGFVVNDPMASRQHARIELRDDKYVLVDQSTNGTWVSIDGEPAFTLRREEVPLHGKGRITLGHPATENAPVVNFAVISKAVA
jgi:adenylate cyclase